MSKLLSLDLGVTTGYAILECTRPDKHALKEHGNILLDELETWLLTIKRLHRPKWIVAEEPLIIRGPLGDQMQQAIEITRAEYPEVVFWGPSQWKSHPLAKKPLPRGLTPHQRDAIRLGYVYRLRVVEKLLSGN